MWIVLNQKILLWGQYLQKLLHPKSTKTFFRKIPRSKKALFVNVGLAESIFTGQITFDRSNLFFEIYDVRPSATKINFEKSFAQKRLCLSMWDACRFNQPARNPLISSNKY